LSLRRVHIIRPNPKSANSGNPARSIKLEVL
jgi:hypothetical protein